MLCLNDDYAFQVIMNLTYAQMPCSEAKYVCTVDHDDQGHVRFSILNVIYQWHIMQFTAKFKYKVWWNFSIGNEFIYANPKTIRILSQTLNILKLLEVLLEEKKGLF